ncbi:integrase [Streptomyces sp. NPDC050743]|uniref:integrase n=1 Tax=Streptomyces sp. NPDC050743 TaxID=3365634 RepID=UPI003788B0DB
MLIERESADHQPCLPQLVRRRGQSCLKHPRIREVFREFQYPTPPLAIYPAESIEAHRAFIARRRATRPSDEYRTPTEEEWDAFLAHFEKRKVSIGTCARAFSSPCVHEHACIRCSLLRPDPAQRGRLEEIRDNLVARIAEAEREGWLGEVEGLKVSLAGAEDKLAQMDATTARTAAAVDLGMPGFTSAAGRSATRDDGYASVAQ